jgi:hypothetical protein
LYPLKLHAHLNPEKWETYSKTQQVLMISNELNRAMNCLKGNHQTDAEKCYERAIELTDLTIEDQRWANGLKELLRFREGLSGLFLSKDIALTRLYLSTLLLFNAEAYNMLCNKE